MGFIGVVLMDFVGFFPLVVVAGSGLQATRFLFVVEVLWVFFFPDGDG